MPLQHAGSLRVGRRRPQGWAIAWLSALLGCGGASSSAAEDSDGATGGPASSGSESETSSDELEIIPAPGGARRLVAREYIGTVNMLLGANAAAAATPPADVAQKGFNAVGAALLSLDAAAVERYEASASLVAAAAVADGATLAAHVPCVAANPTSVCYEQVAEQLGRVAFRRPLEAAEVEGLVAVAEQGQAWGDGDFSAGLRYLLMTLLQSPSFLYVVEVGEPDEDSGYRKLNPYELASRLSLVLLGRGPDEALLDLAEQGGLATPEQLREQAAQMLNSPEARVASAGFFAEYLRLGGLANSSKNAELFPLFNEDLAAAMARETQLLVDDVVWERDGDYREVFTADYTFVNDPLAELYGVDVPGSGDEFVQVQLPADQHRAGYLTHASFLTHQASSTRTSPTKRGAFIQQRVLCNEIPGPPPNVNTTLPDIPADATLREVLLLHMEDPACSCHRATDPIGLSLEHYDAIGAFRQTDNGQTIDASGEVAGLGQWANAQELSAAIAADPRVSACLINNLIRGYFGHEETPGEVDAIMAINDRFVEGGYSVQHLLLELVTSPLFVLVDEPK